MSFPCEIGRKPDSLSSLIRKKSPFQSEFGKGNCRGAEIKRKNKQNKVGLTAISREFLSPPDSLLRDSGTE